MCGICIIIFDTQGQKKVAPEISESTHDEHVNLLRNRGPDFQNIHYLKHCVFHGCTLHFRGALTKQPILDNSGNLLLWNGEIFDGIKVKSTENDGAALLSLLGKCKTESDILTVLSNLRGPWAFIFYEANMDRLWFGRDMFGRRSLLYGALLNQIIISSVLIDYKNVDIEWSEVPANGIYMFSSVTGISEDPSLIHFPWIENHLSSRLESIIIMDEAKDFMERKFYGTGINLSTSKGQYGIINPVKRFNESCPDDEINNMMKLFGLNISEEALHSGEIDIQKLVFDDQNELAENLISLLADAVKKRIEAQSFHCSDCIKQILKKSSSLGTDHILPREKPCGHSRIAILFSGGIDSLIIAALADRYVEISEPIDLLNVAFEQQMNTSQKHQQHDPYSVPDRITGRQALLVLNPERQWNFTEIDVTIAELQQSRSSHIKHLLSPLHTVLDDSIGCAIWFAARGRGFIGSGCNRKPYQTSARVLLAGMGADEQLVGYSRHRAIFNNKGWSGLVEEIKMEIDRISSRNLGRDDRIIADHGKEARFPYLDENVVSFLNSIPLWKKANLHLPRGIGEKFLLRLCASKLGLKTQSYLPKRAIQFGSRIAKSENRKEKASDKCIRLE